MKVVNTFSEERRTESSVVEDGVEPEAIVWWERLVLPFGVLLAVLTWSLAIFGALKLFDWI